MFVVPCEAARIVVMNSAKWPCQAHSPGLSMQLVFTVHAEARARVCAISDGGDLEKGLRREGHEGKAAVGMVADAAHVPVPAGG